jgi:hypothetical protein
MIIEIPSQVVAQLPPHLKPEKISAYMRLSRGLQDFLGETHLFVQEKKLYCLTSSSTFEPLSQVEISETEKPRIVQDGFQQALLLTTKDGKEHKLSILLQEQEAQTFLAALSNEAPAQPASVALSLPAPPISPPQPISTQATKPEENNDDDSDDSDEDEDEDDDSDEDEDSGDVAVQEDASRAKAAERLTLKDYSGAIFYTKEAMEHAEDEDDKEDYKDLIHCIELLAAGDPVLAYFKSHDFGYLYDLSDTLDIAIGEALEAKGEPLLAIRAFKCADEDRFRSKVSQLRSGLGLTEEEEESKVDARFIEWYQKKLEQNPQDAESWSSLASYQQDTEAIESYKKALEFATRDSEDDEESLCDLFEELGRLDELKSFLQERIEKNRSSIRKEELRKKLLALFPESTAPQQSTREPNARPYPIQAVSPTDNLPQRRSNPLNQLFFWGIFLYILIRYVL